MEVLVTRKARQMVGGGGQKQQEPKVGKGTVHWRSGEARAGVHLGLAQMFSIDSDGE